MVRTEATLEFEFEQLIRLRFLNSGPRTQVERTLFALPDYSQGMLTDPSTCTVQIWGETMIAEMGLGEGGKRPGIVVE